ncbi:MFS transporter [Ramlibacter sp. G-1-2-2]|uniref:MFS transporter n=1 Tax=Ramlibacter agri TaxID=2728837 RepID=A0A848HE58_9BURK|nr:MFS transporter [Ramlibacter agri]NML48667.1 MFS transporter [Ramlibacter agri]
MSVLARRQAVAVFLAFAFAYFFAAVLRAITATLSPALTQEFHLNARELGLLAGGYFLGFALIQLPLGTWLDRHGPRKVILGFVAFAVLGCVAFALAQNFYALLASRVLCGIGVSSCLMAPLTGFRRWFTPAVQLRTNSWMLMTGSMGMVASTLPVQWMLPLVGWRPLFWVLAVLMALAMFVIAWRVPDWSKDDSTGGPRGSYAEVWRHPYFRQMTPIGIFSYGGMIAIQALWAGPWLSRVAGYTPLQAAGGLFTINCCMLVSFWTWGWANPWLQRNGYRTDRLIAWGMPLVLLVLAAIVVLGPLAGAWALALFCVASTCLSLAQPAVGMVFPASLAGRALSAYNLVIFLGTFAVQWGIGVAVDAFQALGWDEVSSFRAAFAAYLATSVLSYGWFLWARSHNRTKAP